jgi:creatinine amidohydrolase
VTLVHIARLPAPAVAPDAVLVLPFGAHEQHGPHLPHATDALLVEAVAMRGAELAQHDAAVAPTMPYGVSAHHLGLGATFALRPATLLSLVEDLLESARVSGFRRALLLNGHGGNAGLLAAAANETVARERMVCASASYWDLAASRIEELRRSPHGGMGHACELETALMLHLAPELVNESAIPADELGRRDPLLADDMIAPAPVSLGVRMRHETATGVLGSPRMGDAEHGGQLFSAITEAVATAIDTVAGRPLP